MAGFLSDDDDFKVDIQQLQHGIPYLDSDGTAPSASATPAGPALAFAVDNPAQDLRATFDGYSALRRDVANLQLQITVLHEHLHQSRDHLRQGHAESQRGRGELQRGHEELQRGREELQRCREELQRNREELQRDQHSVLQQLELDRASLCQWLTEYRVDLEQEMDNRVAILQQEKANLQKKIEQLQPGDAHQTCQTPVEPDESENSGPASRNSGRSCLRASIAGRPQRNATRRRPQSPPLESGGPPSLFNLRDYGVNYTSSQPESQNIGLVLDDEVLEEPVALSQSTEHNYSLRGRLPPASRVQLEPVTRDQSEQQLELDGRTIIDRTASGLPASGKKTPGKAKSPNRKGPLWFQRSGKGRGRKKEFKSGKRPFTKLPMLLAVSGTAERLLEPIEALPQDALEGLKSAFSNMCNNKHDAYARISDPRNQDTYTVEGKCVGHFLFSNSKGVPKLGENGLAQACRACSTYHRPCVRMEKRNGVTSLIFYPRLSSHVADWKELGYWV